jgi:DNA-directed RNA polymerase I subunit RPA43
MSVRANGDHVSPPRDAEALTPGKKTKKRKHTSEDKEASTKKKRRRTEDAENATTTQESPTAEVTKKKKKKSTEQDKQASTAQQDVELPDAPDEEEEPSTENPLHESSTAVEGGDGADLELEESLNLLESEDPSSFYSTRISFYLSIPAISLESGGSSLLATHLAPLLLTYFPPAQGIVLSFSDPVISAKPNTGINLPLIPPRDGRVPPQAEVLAKTADEYGVCWVWLTATLLVFRPETGDELHGWTNVTSEGFVGLVSYNYFQTAVEKTRIPAAWKWNGPTKEEMTKNKKKGKKGKLRDEVDQQQDSEGLEDGDNMAAPYQTRIQDDSGYFADASGSKIPSTLKFRVVDTEVVPAHDRTKWSLQIDGTLLEEEAEQKVLAEERAKFERTQQRSRSQTPGGDAFMAGALGLSREASVASVLSVPAPVRHRRAY